VDTIRLISPVDGSLFAERPVASDGDINAALERARAAQAEWARRPVGERAPYLLAFLEALLAMNDEIVPELAWQMGRPVRYGGEKGGVEERTRYMVDLAGAALADSRRPTTRTGSAAICVACRSAS
jgi:acyl-CoA reductase-like NAD-dependent aldehyde dehydrogenase